MYTCSRATLSARRRRGGFTLVENMIAMALLAACVTSLAAGFASTMKADFFNQQNSTALLVASQQSEEIVLHYRQMSTPCTTACGGFTDSNGALVNLSDTYPQMLTTAGDIDYTKTAPAGYQNYVVWGGVRFDVRWNISSIGGVHQVTVAARPKTPDDGNPTQVVIAVP